MAPVDDSDIQRLETLRPALKREWESLLRTEPTLSPLGNPDVLVYLMDETFAQLRTALRLHPAKHWNGRATALRLPLQRHCACGLNPLLNYYATGEIALHVVVARDFNEHLEEVLTCYHLLAQKEIDTLCAVCQHRHPPHRARSPAVASPGDGI